MARAAARSGEWAQHFLNASCCIIAVVLLLRLSMINKENIIIIVIMFTGRIHGTPVYTRRERGRLNGPYGPCSRLVSVKTSHELTDRIEKA